MKHLCATVLFFWPFVPAFAQVEPSQETTQLVATVNEAFFDQITQEDFATEYGFLSQGFAGSITSDDWQAQRQAVIDFAGPTPRFRAHRLTYYQPDRLLAAVDYAAQVNGTNIYICGFVLWEIPAADRIGITRFEQNIVDRDVFRKMDANQAAELMAQWRCPPQIIAEVLGN